VTQPSASDQPSRGLLAAVRDYLRSPPNVLTGMRLVAIPLLWVLAFMGRTRALGIGIGLAFVTDMLDGWLARKLHAETEIGSRTDSLADHMLAASTVAWLFMLRYDFFQAHAPLLFGWIGLALFTLLMAWLRFRRFVDLHLYSAKAAVFLAYTMAVVLLVTGRHWEWHWALAFGTACFAAAESLYVILTRGEADEHTVSAFIRRRR
jgi:CDP-diacylglycerol--glycerol-3-phosphate 3-phosphatidyltransferase